jgi:type II secretion system protein H
MKNGFTLIELLVVILILGIVVAVTTLAVGDFGRSRRLALSLAQFEQLINYTQGQAILHSQLYGIHVNHQGYQFYTLIRHPSGVGDWQTLQRDSLLVFHAWPAGLSVQLATSEGTLSDGLPNIIVWPDGRLSDFRLTARLGTSQEVILSTDDAGGVSMQQRVLG